LKYEWRGDGEDSPTPDTLFPLYTLFTTFSLTPITTHVTLWVENEAPLAEIILNHVVNLAPVQNRRISQRTRNRLREHGQHGWMIKRHDPSSQLFDGAPAILVENEAQVLAGDGWLGWFPLDEVIIQEFGR
jgi:hypothetical protein